MENLKILIVLIGCIHLIGCKVLIKSRNPLASSAETIEAFVSTKGVALLQDSQSDESDLFDPYKVQRYRNNGTLITTIFAMDFCRHISSCYSCIEKRCVYKVTDDYNAYFCRHRLDNDETDLRFSTEPLNTLTKLDDCDRLAKHIGTILSELKPQMHLSFLEIAGIISITLIFMTLLAVVIGFVYVKHQLEQSKACSMDDPVISIYERKNPEKINLMDVPH